MSPPSGHVPFTPDRRASTQALFNAFRSLTGGRLKSTTPPPSTSSVTGTSTRNSSVASARPASFASPHSADGTRQRTSHISGLRNGQPIVGGPPELEELCVQLDSSRPFPERALAAERICKILEEYPVQNILSLWSIASDLLLPEQPDEVAETGYKLLRACASLPKLTTVERTVFFDATSLRKNDRCFDKRLDIVTTLTKHGRDVEACESYIVSFLLTSLETCFKASNASRKANGKRSVDDPSQDVVNLARVFQYAIDLCKFNAKVFIDDDLELLLTRAMTICQETTKENDMEMCIKLFDTVITYVYVPTKALRPCLEILCLIHRQITSLQEQTWNTLSNLFRSHVGQAAISSLLHTLLDGPTRKIRQHNLYRGTIYVLELLLLEDGRNGLPRVPIILLFQALKASIKEPHQSQEESAINLVDAVLTNENLRNLLLSQTDLSDLLEIVHICAERDDDRFRARAAGTNESSNVAKKDVSSEKSLSAHENGSLNKDTMGPPASIPSIAGDIDVDIGPYSDPPTATSMRPEIIRRNLDDSISQVLLKLDRTSDIMDFVHKEAVMELFLRLAHRLSDETAEKMIRYFTEERYLNPSNINWMEFCRSLIARVLKDITRPRSLRILVIQAMRETYATVEKLCASDIILQCGTLLLNNIDGEDDVEVLTELVDFAVNVADQASFASFSDIIKLLQRRLDQPRTSSTAASPSWSSHSFLGRSDLRFGSPSNVIATAYVRLFVRSVTNSAQKTRVLYETLRRIAGSDKYENDARLTSLKLLFRLRADSRFALIVSASSEGERIAAELCRTKETAVAAEKIDEGMLGDRTKSEDVSSWREQRKTSGSSPHSSVNRQTGRVTAAASRVFKPIPPLWMYPGPKGLPEEPSTESSHVVFSHIDAEEYPLSDSILDMEITLWLELVISLLQRPPDWEIYSYVLVHLGPQLSNQALVRSCVVQLRMMRNVLCEQVRNSSFHEPPPHTLLKKADVAVCLFHILTVIISYHDHFEKSEEDDLVKAFLQGIVQWDRTSKWCIHALSVCCLEIPLSVSKSLDSIIQKMSQIVTKPATAIHILEFLTSLARLPELFKNFREEEFKLVFGVCFRYMQHIRDQRDRATNAVSSQNGHRTLRPSGASKDVPASSDSKKARLIEDDLPHYLYSLAFHVITFWFMALKMEDRPKQIPWITKNLLYTDNSGRQVMEEQAQVIVDVMAMVAYTDRDQTMRDENFAKPGDGEIWKKTWILPYGLLTIETAARTGVSLITTRRPCGTRYFTIRPLLASPPRHQVPLTVGLASDAFYSSSYVGILPDDIFQSFYAPLDLTNPPIPLPDDDMTRRAIASFDRIATVDNYKVGVIYIGEGQTNERDIFMNDIGSPAYTSFLSDLGTLRRLKNAKFNTGGLDTRADMDGEFTYCWRDRCLELVFHVTTMMPTNRDDEMTYPNKKRHIGNDFVNIIFNDSGLPYNFETFPSAFNYVHIVISPESKASFVDRRLDEDPDGRNRYYKVQVISRHDFPNISPAAETKIICGKHLAAYCRLIAINSCVFSNVWFIREGGESISSWRNRLREIKRLRERYGGSDSQVISSPSSPALSQGISSPPPRDQNGASPFQRMSVATFITEGTNRSSISSASHDV